MQPNDPRTNEAPATRKVESRRPGSPVEPAAPPRNSASRVKLWVLAVVFLAVVLGAGLVVKNHRAASAKQPAGKSRMSMGPVPVVVSIISIALSAGMAEDLGDRLTLQANSATLSRAESIPGAS